MPLTKQIVGPYEMAVRQLMTALNQLDFAQREHGYQPTKGRAILIFELQAQIRKLRDEIRKYEAPVQVALCEVEAVSDE